MATYDIAIYLVVRNDLKMGKGKIAAQCGHAVQFLTRQCPEDLYREYNRNGCAKIALKVEGYQEFKALEQALLAANISHFTVVDAGRTQIEPGTETCIGIGPLPKEILQKYVSELKLL